VGFNKNKTYAFQQNEVAFLHVDLKHSKNDETITYYHIDMKKDLPCNRITRFDKYLSRYLPPERDFSYDGFVKFTDRVLNGKIKVHHPIYFHNLQQYF